jgi:NADP-dependent 3-hydroxy acid dehydrogenase YdfG
MMSAEEIADHVMFVVTRPRSQRVLETEILPMNEDSLG